MKNKKTINITDNNMIGTAFAFMQAKTNADTGRDYMKENNSPESLIDAHKAVELLEELQGGE